MLDALPMTRDARCPFDPPGELARIREGNPLTRLKYPNGHEGWLATDRANVRAILADPRFSARYELVNLPISGPMGGPGGGNAALNPVVRMERAAALGMGRLRLSGCRGLHPCDVEDQ